MFSDDKVDEPRHLSTGKCLCQFIEQHFRRTDCKKEGPSKENAEEKQEQTVIQDSIFIQENVQDNNSGNNLVSDEETIEDCGLYDDLDEIKNEYYLSNQLLHLEANKSIGSEDGSSQTVIEIPETKSRIKCLSLTRADFQTTDNQEQQHQRQSQSNKGKNDGLQSFPGSRSLCDDPEFYVRTISHLVSMKDLEKGSNASLSSSSVVGGNNKALSDNNMLSNQQLDESLTKDDYLMRKLKDLLERRRKELAPSQPNHNINNNNNPNNNSNFDNSHYYFSYYNNSLGQMKSIEQNNNGAYYHRHTNGVAATRAKNNNQLAYGQLTTGHSELVTNGFMNEPGHRKKGNLRRFQKQTKKGLYLLSTKRRQRQFEGFYTTIAH